MNDVYLDAIKEAFAIAPSEVVTYHTLEIRQSGVQDPVFIVQNFLPITANDEGGITRDFEPVGFQFALPQANEEGFRSLTLAIDNISRRVTDFVTIAQTSTQQVEVIYRPYISTDLTRPQMDPPLTLYLKDVEITKNQVTGRATFMDLVNKPFPSELYTRDLFPTL